MKVFLVIHDGYDFDPTTLAVCSTREKAELYLRKHYEDEDNADYPWNGCGVHEVEMDRTVPEELLGGQRANLDLSVK